MVTSSNDIVESDTIVTCRNSSTPVRQVNRKNTINYLCQINLLYQRVWLTSMVNNSSKGTEIKDDINRPIDCQTSTDELDVSVDAGRLESMKL